MCRGQIRSRWTRFRSRFEIGPAGVLLSLSIASASLHAQNVIQTSEQPIPVPLAAMTKPAVGESTPQSPPPLLIPLPPPITTRPAIVSAPASEFANAPSGPSSPTAAKTEAPKPETAKSGDSALKSEGEKGAVECPPETEYGIKSLFDSLHPPGGSKKHWYEKLNIRGYTQFRFSRTLDYDRDGADPSLLGDRSVNGRAENFSIRRARFILYGDVSDYLSLYAQPDFASTPPDSSRATFFGQLRDLYGDVYLDKEKVHRFRVGLSKVPFGFENMQSSQNRAPLDRTDAINTGVSPNERDLGVFYYWTPEDKQKLFKDLVDGGLKGSGNYGIFGIGAYNGQGGSLFEQNLLTHVVARATLPIQFSGGQVMEASVQGYTGKIVVPGSDIRPLGEGDAATPDGTGGRDGLLDQRVGATFVWYPQPFGFQAEWNVGKGPGLNDEQTEVVVRSLQGGYLMAMYRHDTHDCGILTPYVRYQYFKGGYRSTSNAPYGTHDEWNIGIEWQIRREMELVVEYARVNGMNLSANDDEGAVSYRNFDGHLLRVQFQLNY